MKYIIHPSKEKLSGSLVIPPSKSHTLRALLFAMMGKGKTTIYRYLPSPDTTAMCQAIAALGAQVAVFPDRIEIEGTGGQLTSPDAVIDAGNSGQVLRFISAFAALLPTYTIVTGDHSVRYSRPAQPLLDGLRQLGGFAVSSRLNGQAPLIIKGPIQAGTATIQGMDSQPVSALLMAAAFVKGVTHVLVQHPGELPWIDLTLSWLKKFGVHCEHHGYTHYKIHGGIAYGGFEYTVPGDWSSAAYPLAAALVTHSEITLENIDFQDVQGDKKLVQLLIDMGAEIDTSAHSLKVRKNSSLQGGRIDVNDCIDALPILAVLGCFGTGKLEIFNGAIARKKESDRIHAIATELKKMGAHIEEREDGLIITPGPLKGSRLSTYSDHRLVLSLSVAALGAHGRSEIEGVECVTKTYPDFAEQMCTLGAEIERFA